MIGARHGERGVLLITSLLFTLMLAMAGGTMLMRALSETQASNRSRSQSVALHLAEAAVDRAALNLRTPTDLADDVTSGTLPTGSFTIDAPPTSVATNIWKITAHGTAGSDTANVEGVFQFTPESIFQWAMFGDERITVSGNATTDSYDSALGPYGGANTGDNGDVGTNASTAGGVTVSGSIFVDGQVAVGPGVSDPTTVVTGYDPSFITSTPKVVSMGTPVSMPSVTVPPGLTCEDYTINSNATTTLAPGTYCYRNLTLSGNSTLTSTGVVTIYLTGSLTASGNSTFGVVNDPTQVTLLMTSNADATIDQGSVTGNSNFYGAIYGPDANFNITGNAEIFGSIIAQRVTMSGSAYIHYDESLVNNTTISTGGRTALVYWKKL